MVHKNTFWLAFAALIAPLDKASKFWILPEHYFLWTNRREAIIRCCNIFTLSVFCECIMCELWVKWRHKYNLSIPLTFSFFWDFFKFLSCHLVAANNYQKAMTGQALNNPVSLSILFTYNSAGQYLISPMSTT